MAALSACKPQLAARPARTWRAPCARVARLVVRAEAEPSAPVPAPQPAVPAPVPEPKTVSLSDAMAFSGPAPEVFNGRMAMLGVTAAFGAELASGESVFTQFSDAPLPILGLVAVFAAASLVPILKGADTTEAFGPFSRKAELLNGRAAMLGIAALLAIEVIKGSALI